MYDKYDISTPDTQNAVCPRCGYKACLAETHCQICWDKWGKCIPLQPAAEEDETTMFELED